MSAFTLDGLEPTLDSTQATLDGSTGGGLSGAATDTTNATAALNGGVLLAAVAASTTAAAASLTQFASVVLTAPLFTGVGGIFDPGGTPWSNGAPPVGATVFYDPTNGQVLADGSVFSPTTNNFSMVCQWLPSPGVLSERIIVMTPQMVGTAFDVTSAQGSLTVTAILAGAANDATTAAGALSTQLEAAAASSTSASATLTPGAAQLTGAASSSTNASATLQIALLLRAAAADVTSAVGALTVAGNLLAAALDTTSASGALTVGAALTGSASSVTSSSATLTAQASLAAAAANLTSALGTLTVRALLAVSALSATSASGSLTVFSPLAGSASDTTTATAQLNPPQALLVGAAADLSSAAATITVQSQFFANAADTTSAKASLPSPVPLPGNILRSPFRPGNVVHAPFAPASSVLGPTPFGEFLVRVGDVIAYGIDWTGWIANYWQPGLQATLTTVVRPGSPNGFQATCTTAGQTGTIQPGWPSFNGATVPDGSAIWTMEPIDNTSLVTTVSGATWQVPADIETDGQLVSGQLVAAIIDFSSAIAGVDYLVTVPTTFSNGQVMVGKFKFRVR
jgi:hypothetical protein